jgi:hypothetical protein
MTAVVLQDILKILQEDLGLKLLGNRTDRQRFTFEAGHEVFVSLNVNLGRETLDSSAAGRPMLTLKLDKTQPIKPQITNFVLSVLWQ